MKVKLSLSNRIYLPTLFPKQGNFETGIIVMDIQKKIQVTQDEVLQYNIKTITDETGNQSVSWTPAPNIEVEFTDLEIKLLVDTLIEKNDKKELGFDFDTLNMYSQIVLKKELQ